MCGFISMLTASQNSSLLMGLSSCGDCLLLNGMGFVLIIPVSQMIGTGPGISKCSINAPLFADWLNTGC